MKETIRRMAAILITVSMLAAGMPFAAFAENEPATPTDLAPVAGETQEEPGDEEPAEEDPADGEVTDGNPAGESENGESTESAGEDLPELCYGSGGIRGTLKAGQEYKAVLRIEYSRNILVTLKLMPKAGETDGTGVRMSFDGDRKELKQISKEDSESTGIVLGFGAYAVKEKAHIISITVPFDADFILTAVKRPKQESEQEDEEETGDEEEIFLPGDGEGNGDGEDGKEPAGGNGGEGSEGPAAGEEPEVPGDEEENGNGNEPGTGEESGNGEENNGESGEEETGDPDGNGEPTAGAEAGDGEDGEEPGDENGQEETGEPQENDEPGEEAGNGEEPADVTGEEGTDGNGTGVETEEPADMEAGNGDNGEEPEDEPAVNEPATPTDLAPAAEGTQDQPVNEDRKAEEKKETEEDQAEKEEEDTEETEEAEVLPSDEELLALGYYGIQVVMSEGADVYDSMEDGAEPVEHLEAGEVLWVRPTENDARAEIYRADEEEPAKYIRWDDVMINRKPEPETEDEEEELPARSIEITSTLWGMKSIPLGQEITMTAELINFREDDQCTYQWQYFDKQTDTYIDIAGANELTYVYYIDTDNFFYTWRLVVIITNDD